MTAPVNTPPAAGVQPIGRTTALSPLSIADRVAEKFDALFATVDEWRDRLAGRLELDSAPTASSLDPFVEASAVPALEADGLITGSGFVAAPGLLSDAHWHLAWWLGGAAGIRRLATIDDPSNDQFRDYTSLEWWRFPARTGTRHLTGPHVDYVCTDDYTVTITTPVLVAGRLLGVVGMDVLVDRLERELLPLLRESGTPTTIVNASGRVVTSTDSRREPGAMLRLEGLEDALSPLREPVPPPVRTTLPSGAEVIACGRTSLALVVGL